MKLAKSEEGLAIRRQCLARQPLFFSTLISTILCLTPGLYAAANMTPIALTGWNVDVVIEASASGPPFTKYASEIDATDGRAYYQTGLPTYAWGMPPSGGFVSLVGDNTLFQFQPYTNKNALILSPDTKLTNGTLHLVGCNI